MTANTAEREKLAHFWTANFLHKKVQLIHLEIDFFYRSQFGIWGEEENLIVRINVFLLKTRAEYYYYSQKMVQLLVNSFFLVRNFKYYDCSKIQVVGTNGGRQPISYFDYRNFNLGL